MMSTGVCRWLFLLISLATWTSFTNSKEMRVVCYYTNWSVYRPGAAKFNPQNINPYLCTHLIYAFGGFTKENTLKPFDKYQDLEKGGYAKFTGLKTYNKNLKTMLAIGGWNEGSSRFSPMVASAERRKELVKNTIKFLRQNHFDGLDLDWEYPTFRDGGKPRDRDNYAQLVEELREEFDRESEKTGRPRLLLTMAVPAGIEYINKGYDVPKLMKHLDWMNILSYDYHSAFEPAVNHHAPLYSLEEDNEYNYDAELNIDYTIKHYMKLGADPNKLVLGIPTYGRSYTLYNPDAYEIGAPADGPGDMGEATRENGYLAYYEICEYVKSQGWQVEQPNPSAMGPYAYKDNQWVGYDDEAIVRKKSEYVVENGLGGIMFWAIDNDDFRGTCHGKPYPLIEAAKEALLDAFGTTDDNLISPPNKIKSRTRTRTKSAGKIKSNDDEETKVEKVSTSSGNRRRNRLKSKAKDEDRESASTRQKPRRKESRTTTEATTHSSLKVVTPSYTTPAPPSTPELDGAFKCEDEGFFPHPKDCKKYFWCLSGAGDSGIVAHQFTCPAGLYFNKAADSCDYTQNVLCNKKLQRATSTTTSSSVSSTATTTTPASTVFSTSRAPPKITAATSRTTFKVTTTTEAYDDEYEYEDEEEEDEEKDGKGKIDSEEDPRVIKELIELIKKAGGLEELERQLSGSKTDVTNPSSGSTTPSSISKSLYERVLNKAVKNSLTSRKNTLSALRNSRGPQNDGLSEKAESSSSSTKTDRGKLQYTSIARRRPSTEKSVDEEEDEEVKDDEEVKEDPKTRRTFSKKYQPEYVTIRRPRVSTTTEATEADSSLNRNRILGETSDEEYDDDESIDDESEEDEDTPVRKVATPQYVNIRRQRPSTTEEPTTSKYTVIRRGSTSTTESTPEANEEGTTSKYKTIRRGSTSSPTTTPEQESSSSRYQLRRGTTISTTPSTVSDGATSRFKNFRRGSTTSKPVSNVEETTSLIESESDITTPLDDENDVTPRSSTAVRSTTETAGVDNSKYQIITRSTSTVQPEVDAIVTIATSKDGLLSGSSTEIGSTVPSDEDKVTTLANIIDDVVTSEPSSAVKSEIPAKDTKEASETKTSTSSSPEKGDATPEVIDNETETSQKNHPQLLDPRPFSVFSRGASSTVKTITEPPVQSSKVSQSNFKFRLKPKTSDLHDTSTILTSTTSETPVAKSNFRSRGRGGSRFTVNNQNNNNNAENTEEDLDSKVKVRKRVSTTERYIEENRTYRPSELADLSSLTAVDFAKVKELNFGRAAHRRRGRPTPSTTAASAADNSEEEVADESLKTSTRALPLTRKRTDQINSSSEITTAKRIRGFGSRTTRQPSVTESSNKINESPSSDFVNVTPRSRRVVRRFRTTTVKPAAQKDADISGKTSNDIQSLRRRTFATKNEQTAIGNSTTNETVSANQSPLQKLFNKKPTRLPFAFKKEEVEEENDDSAEDTSTEEGENIKLSESNIRENSDVNSYDVGGKQNRRAFKLVRPKSDILHGKAVSEKGSKDLGKTVALERNEETTTEQNISDQNIKTEVTNDTTLEIKTSTENNSNVNPTEVSIEETTVENNKVTEKPNESIKTSTQPGVRARKVIRKLKSTTTTTTTERTSTTDSTTNRKRKIIRRLRPINSLKQNLETSSTQTINQTQSEELSPETPLEKEVTATKHLFRPSLTRPKSKYIKANLEKESTEETEEEKQPVRIALRRLPNRNSTIAHQNENSKNLTSEDDQDSRKHLFRPKLSESRNKYKSLAEAGSKRPHFKPFLRSTTATTKDIVESSTENLKSANAEQKENEEAVSPIETTSIKSNEDDSTTDSIQIETVSKPIFQQESNISTPQTDLLDDIKTPNETFDPSTEASNIDNSVTTTESSDNSTEDNRTEEDVVNTTGVATDGTTNDVTTDSTEANVPETTTVEDTLGMVLSTTLVNRHTSPPSTTGRTEKDDTEDDDDDDESGERKSNYVSIFRSSTTSNLFKDFDSETEMEPPKFEDLFEEKDHKAFFDDEIKFDDHKEFGKFNYGHDDDDDEDDYYKYDDDSLIGGTSTEFRSEFFSPNDVTSEEKTEAQPKETSSIRNHFYRPNRPAFIRPKFTFSTTEKQDPERPKYKTFSRTSTKTLRKETIQIHSFNDTDGDGNPEKAVNKVLLNRYKSTSSESTTSSPVVINLLNSNEKDTSSEEEVTSVDTTTVSHITPEETTQNSQTKSVADSNTETTFTAEATVTNTEETAEVTTQLNTYNMDLTTEANEIPTIPPETSTVTDNSLLETDTVISTSEESVTESLNISELSEQNNSNVTTSPTEDSVDSTDSTTEIPLTTIENITTTTPEPTTPYKRRSTLRPINSRPRFNPAKLKNVFLATSTTEQTAEGLRNRNKYHRNRYQKSTTESITPESSEASILQSVVRSSTPTSINKFLYKHSTTRSPISYTKEDEEEKKEDEVELSEEKPPQNEQEIEEFKATSAIPINQYIFTRRTTEADFNENEESGNEQNDREEDNVEEEGGDEDNDEEEEVEENVEATITDTSSKTPINNYNSRLPRPKSPRISNTPSAKKRPNSPRGSNTPFNSGRSTTARVVNRPVFSRTTETPKVAEDLSNIDTEAVKNRNKNLFSKHRKANTPVSAVSDSPVEESATEAVTDAINSFEVTTGLPEYTTVLPSTSESVTKASVPETTELLTTLHHIFAEVNDSESNIETTTELQSSPVTPTTGKIERLIEVNRIVKVQTKEAKIKNHVLEEQPTAEVMQPTLDKIGEINRVTVIKVVDGNNTIVETTNSQENEIKQVDPLSPVYTPETTTGKSRATLPDLAFIEHPAKVEEVPAPKPQGNINLTDITVTIDKIPELLHTHARDDRKFEIFSKSNDLTSNNEDNTEKKTQIIDGISHINVITPRPIFTEASTIPLEGLFQTESAKSINNLKVSPYDEVLETEHSKFVNVRVLHPDENFGKSVRDDSRLLSIRLLDQDGDHASLRAKVVEVRPKSNLDTIKIVPIKVEMAKRLSDSLPVLRVTPQDTEYKSVT